LAKAKNTKEAETRQIAVIGLGRFGRAIARELVATGHDVLGVDSSEDEVQRMSGQITQTIQADSTIREALEEINIQNFERVVVSIGSNVEASILTASLLLELGIKEIWAKANSDAHGRILRQLGIKHVVFPEEDMGKRLAHQIGGDQLDYVEIDEGFILAKTTAAETFIGKTLSELSFRSKYNVIVVATSHGDASYVSATPDTLISAGDWLIVAGGKIAVDRFTHVK
jgi:trk system potassium uptake protein TrkA